MNLEDIECWCICDGAAGKKSQVLGVAETLGVRHKFVTSQRLPSQGLPQMIISSGCVGAYAALNLRKRLGKKVYWIHTERPPFRPESVDLIVAPRHDGIRGKNVVRTLGAVHNLTSEKLAAFRNSPLARSIEGGKRGKVVCVLVGGPNRECRFEIVDMINKLKRLKRVRIVVVKSPRTPDDAVPLFEKAFGREHFVWKGTGENPYLPALSVANYIVVTGDSVSMISEASTTEVPLYVAFYPAVRGRSKFTRFHEGFSKAGITRPFRGSLSNWSYSPPQDNEIVAEVVRR